MSKTKLEALKRKLEDLRRISMIVPVDDAKHAAPVFLVPKKKKGEYRMVVDLRKLNEATIPASLTLPEIQVQLSCLPPQAKYFCTLDMQNGFDLLEIDPRDRWIFVFSTVFGLFEMRGAPMGYHSTPSVYQNRVVRYILGYSASSQRLGTVNKSDDLLEDEGTFCRPFNGALLWIDDILIYGSTFQGFKQVINRILSNMRKYKVRFNAMKCSLITSHTDWCGRRISREGWRFAESHYEKILHLNRPTNLAQLEQVLYVITWLGDSIPNCSHIKGHFQSLVDKLRNENQIIDRKKRRSDTNISLSGHWTVVDEERYKQLLKPLYYCSRTNLKNYDSSKEVHIFTDASKYYFGSVLTQRHGDFYKPFSFLSGKFTNNSLNWSINDKELYSVVFSIKRFDYLIDNSRVIVHTDHKNLIYLRKPESRTTKGGTLSRIKRWNIFLL